MHVEPTKLVNHVTQSFLPDVSTFQDHRIPQLAFGWSSSFSTSAPHGGHLKEDLREVRIIPNSKCLVTTIASTNKKEMKCSKLEAMARNTKQSGGKSTRIRSNNLTVQDIWIAQLQQSLPCPRWRWLRTWWRLQCMGHRQSAKAKLKEGLQSSSSPL